MSSDTDPDTDTDDDSTDYRTETIKAKKAAFGDSPLGYSRNNREAQRQILREEAGTGDVAAAEKLLGIDDSAPEHGPLAKSLKESDEDAPEWALAMLDAIQANTEAIAELNDEDEPKQHEVFTK